LACGCASSSLRHGLITTQLFFLIFAVLTPDWSHQTIQLNSTNIKEV
jgi:hypothetical protein